MVAAMIANSGSAPALVQERVPELLSDLERHGASLRHEIADGERALAASAAPEDAGIAHGAAADLYERELLVTELMGFKRDLREIEAALGRMRAGMYGLCVDCGRPMPLDRLVTRPQAARDVECQRHAEREAAL
jgi:DnaK suppressor protein